MYMIPHDISSSGGEVHCTSNKERIGHDHQADDSWKLQGSEEWWRNCFQHFYSQRLVWGGRWELGLEWVQDSLQDYLLTRYCQIFNINCSSHGCGINDPCKQGKVLTVRSLVGDIVKTTSLIWLRAWAVQRSGAACQDRALRPVDSSSAPWRTWHYVQWVLTADTTDLCLSRAAQQQHVRRLRQQGPAAPRVWVGGVRVRHRLLRPVEGRELGGAGHSLLPAVRATGVRRPVQKVTAVCQGGLTISLSRGAKWGHGILYYPNGRLMFKGEMRSNKILKGQSVLLCLTG